MITGTWDPGQSGGNSSSVAAHDPESPAGQVWYAYVGHDYEGPMELEDLVDRIRAGELTSAHYVWSGELPDWTLLEELPQFRTALLESPNAGKASPHKAYGHELPEPAHSDTRIHVPEPASPSAIRDAGPANLASSEPKRQWKSRWIVASAAIAIPVAAVGVLFALDRGRTPEIPVLSELGESENRALRSAALEPLKQAGPKVDFAISNQDPYTPVFFVATNLPDGARFEVTVESMDGTIADKRQLSARTLVTARGGLGKTHPFRQPDGQPFPAGRYQVYVTDSPSMPAEISPLIAGRPDLRPADAPEKLPSPVRMIAQKTVFLGGSPDAVYERSLQEFNARLRDEARMELMELGQYAETLENQLTQSTDVFRRALQKGAPKQAQAAFAAWKSFRPQRIRLTQKFREDLADVASPDFEKQYFYAVLYRKIAEAADALNRQHQAQDRFLKESGKTEKEESRIAADAAVLQSLILSIKSKLALVESHPPGPSGAPWRNGL